MSSLNRISLIATWLISSVAADSNAQQVTTTVPSQSLGSGFSESISSQWSLGTRNGFINVNNQVGVPGSVDLTNSGLNGGVGFVGNGVSGNLGFNFAQGSNRSITSAAPSLTTMNGYPGSFFSGEIRPFVTGVTPVVGAYPGPDRTLAEFAIADQQAKLSAIAQGNAKRQNDRLRNYLLRAERAESEGEMKTARANYRWAAALADPPLRSMIQSVLRERFAGRVVRTAK